MSKTEAARNESREIAAGNFHQAMSHPLRSRMLLELGDNGPASPSALARKLGAEVPNVAHHMNQLVRYKCAELIDTRRVGNVTEKIFRGTAQHLIETRNWANISPEFAGSFLGEIMQIVNDGVVASMEAELVGSDDKFHMTRTPLRLDVEGRDEVLDIIERAREEIVAAEERSLSRREVSGEDVVNICSSHIVIPVPGF